MYAGVDQALFFGPSRKPRNKPIIQNGCKVFICIEKIRTTRQVVCCTVDTESKSLRVDRPFVIQSSVHIFVEQWSLVREGLSISAYSLPFSRLRISHEGGEPGPQSRIVADFVLSGKGELQPCKAFELSRGSGTIKAAAADAATTPRSARACQVDDGGHDGHDPDLDDPDDFEYGFALLTESAGAAQGDDAMATAEAAAAASLSEAGPATLEGEVDRAAVQEMVQRVTKDIDDDLEVMRSAEEDLLQKAVSEKSVSSEEIQAAVDKFCADGMSPDDAVREAVLNSIKILGNTEVTEDVEPQKGCDIPEAGSAAAPHMSSQQRESLAFTTFCSELLGSMRCVLQCLHEHASSTRCDKISLVLSPVEIAGQPTFQSSRRLLLVSWDTEGKTGRVARVDSDWRLVSMVCVGHNRLARSFQHCTKILLSCGIAMERVKQRERQALPEHVVRIAQMFLQCERVASNAAERDVQQQSGSPEQWDNIVSAAEECVYCRCLHVPSSSSSSSAQAHAPSHVPQQCPLCLLYWHETCAENFVDKYAPVFLKLPELPRTTATPAASRQSS